MKKFRFSLQKVLDVSRAKEKIALEEFVRVQNLIFIQKAKLAEFEEEYNETLEISVVKLSGMKNRQNYLRVLQIQIANVQKKIKELQIDSEAKKLILIEKMRERKLLEKLREKAWEKHKKEQEYEEQLFLDEIGVIGFSRKEGALQ